jgi:6-phosphogluconolactonase
MKRGCASILAMLSVLLGFALLSASVQAQVTYVYTNNNAIPNTVTGFSVGPNGTLTMIPSTPVVTGGNGTGSFFASNTATATMRRNFLYVSNNGTNNISAFKIDTSTGVLTAVPGSPFATGGSGGLNGISLAVTPDGEFLYAGNGASNNISEFSIDDSSGALTALLGSPFPLGDTPDGIKVTPNGKFLGVSLTVSDKVAMLSIGSNGALTSVPGSPFPQGGTGPGTGVAYVDISCNSKQLFASLANVTSNTQVAVSTIGSNGALSPIVGSPFTFTPGSNSNVGILSPDNQWLFVSNQASNTITTLDVESNGSLAQVSGSPFAEPPGAADPNGMATNREGTLLYAANGFTNSVAGFTIDGNGALTSVPLSPFATGGTGFLTSLTTFPAKKVEGEGDENGDDGHKGHYEFEGENECETHGEMKFEEDSPGGEKMRGSVDSMTVTGNTALISGSGTLADGTPVHYTAIAVGNSPVVALNQFAISWITATGSVFKTSGALTDGYIAVHP